MWSNAAANAGSSHGCGEHNAISMSKKTANGSSPRMRGALELDNVYCQLCGIIPTDAGSTWSRPAPAARTGDHPRGCGEHESSKLLIR